MEVHFSFVMVFASLIEYAVVSYMNKKMAQRREKRRRQVQQRVPFEMPMYDQISSTSDNKMVPFDKLQAVQLTSANLNITVKIFKAVGLESVNTISVM